MRQRGIGVPCVLVSLLLTLGCAGTRSPGVQGTSREATEILRQRAEILRAEDRREPEAARAAVSHESPEVRAAAARALGRIGEPSDRAALEALLGDPVAAVRAEAAIALGLAGDRAATPALVARAADPDREVRAAVAHGLGRLADPGSADAVVRLLSDTEPDVVVAACFAVLGFERPAFAVDPLLALGESSERDVLLAALEALASLSARPRWLELGPLQKARTRMIELTTSRYPELRRLGAVGLTVPAADAEAAAVGKLVEDTEVEVRIAAIAALSFPGAPLEPFLVKVLGDKDERVRLALVDGLGRMRGDDILAALADIVVSNDAVWLREIAVRAAAKVSELSPRLANGVARSSEPELRRASTALLIGRIDAASEPLARKLYEDPDLSVRAAIVPAFAEIEGRLVDTLASSIDTEDPRLRAGAAEAAGRRLGGEGRLGPDAKDDAIAVLVRLWPDGQRDPRVALAVVNAAARTGPDDRLRKIFEDALGSSYHAVALAATRSLARIYSDSRPEPRPIVPDRPVEHYLDVLRWAQTAHAAIVTIERPNRGERGRFTIRLDARDKPLVAWSFVDLARRGFYDALPFFRVVPNGIAVTGDLSRDGRGRPEVELRDELGAERFWPGTVALVSSGQDDGGTQWLFTLRAQPFLATTHTAFGAIVQNFAGVASRILPGDSIVGIQIYDGDGTEPLTASTHIP